MNKIKWIFFDIGGVLLDDSQAKKNAERLLLEIIKKYDNQVSLSKIDSALIQGSPKHGSLNENVVKYLISNLMDQNKALTEYKYRKSEINYYEVSSVRPEAKEVLTILAKKYKLGLIANQNVLAKKNSKKPKFTIYCTIKQFQMNMGSRSQIQNIFRQCLLKLAPIPKNPPSLMIISNAPLFLVKSSA